MTNATYEQLIQIVFAEDCSLDDKYAAARELHMRKHQDTKLRVTQLYAIYPVI